MFDTRLSLTLNISLTLPYLLSTQQLLPGGVNSPVRAFGAVGGNPIVFDKVKGAYIYDVDNQHYIDYVGTWGPAILGHSHPKVVEGIQDTLLHQGTSFGAPSVLENELAELVLGITNQQMMIRFTNSGTEACMGMVRLARAYTGRDIIIKMNGCYHGHADSFLVQAGSGVATLGLPDSPGVPKTATQHTLCVEYNDIDSVHQLLEQHKHQIAAVIVEPVVGNSGFITPNPNYLQELRQLTKQHDTLLVFDEVMTGFRVALGGACEYYGIQPDLVTFGKIIGGGLPVGAYAGRKDIMMHIAPAGNMYQAGTLSGNPLAMRAGIETLRILKQENGLYAELERKSKKLVNGIIAAGKKHGHIITGDAIGGMFGWFFMTNSSAKTSIQNFSDAQEQYADTASKERFARWHRGMLERGVYLAPSMYEAGFMSMAHTDDDIERTIAIADEVFSIL